ncbi:MAG: GTP 3',8-cyclase MoaA [Acidobacteria bacterium]|nr:GTP 3',8-cyclase MoaA [Acidobacteriota bacterium]
MLTDSYGRQIRDLRISLTDRCNFRCFYCLPDGEPPLARKATILTFEEIVEISEIFVALGIEKIRLTGGEPLLRKDVERLVEKIARLKDPANVSKELLTEPEANPKSEIRNPKLLDLALTTNGHTLDRRAEALKQAGLDRVTVSLDSLDPANFRDLTGVDRLAETLAAIAAAKRAGLEPVRVNAVVVRGRNDHEIVALARFAREQALAMRFIEYMPLDSKNEWDRKLVVSGREIRQTIDAVFPLVLSEQTRGSATAWKYAFADGAPGEIGIIAPVTEMFCGACSRIRLTADGQLRTCLFSTREHNLRDVLRGGADRAEIVRFIREAVNRKEPRHTINDEQFAPASRSMSFIGG